MMDASVDRNCEQGELECLECGQFFLSIVGWEKHLPECVPWPAPMTTSQLDAAYEEALRRGGAHERG